MSGRAGTTYGSERESKPTATPTGLVFLTLALLAVALVVPAIAQAYRSATRAEQSEMERSAVLYHENPHDYVPGTGVRITGVKVSTAAPWALASVTLKVNATGEEFTGPEIFRPIDGQWTDVGPLNEEPASMVPEAVAKDLGVPYLASSESSTSASSSGNTSTAGSSGSPHILHVLLLIEIYASWLVGVIFMLSAWLRRPEHFKRIGRSKLAWMGITLLGLVPFVGFIPALVYFWRVYLRLPDKHPADQSGARRKPVPRAPNRPAEHLVECPICRGRRFHPCRVCGGTGRLPGTFGDRCGCNGGTVSCERCNARGTVRG